MADPREPASNDNQSLWLPSHLARSNQKILSNPKIKQYLVTAPFASIADQSDWPVVPEHLNLCEKSSPTQICTFLGWLLITRVQRIRDFDIFIQAISFDNEKMYQKWIDRTGEATMLSASIDGFLDFAQSSLFVGKKVVALANPYLNPKFACPTESLEKRAACFLQNSRSMGLGVLVRIMVRDARLCLQLVLFSPFESNEEIRQSWVKMTNLANEWHRIFIEKTSKWAAKIDYPLKEVYVGGKVNSKVRLGGRLDSMRSAGNWCQLVAYNSTEAIPQDTVTDTGA